MKVALMGHGVVGSGVAEILLEKKESLAEKAGSLLELVKILDLRDFPQLSYQELFTKDFSEIESDDSISIVVEAMGGLHPAYEYVKSCLEKGKSVVTSNKELVAEKGAELLAVAKEKNVNFFFEASVGGGIPVIRPMHLCLAANELKTVYGILNGTTNFILTKMIREQMSFEKALSIAQELGYAEKDPTADVEGIDACRKICILASIACKKHIYPKDVYAEGITKITAEDVAYASAAGYVVKLIGQAKLGKEQHQVMVTPALVPVDHQLSGVDDVFNAVLIEGDCTGDVMFYGKGAGKMPTASAVVADVVHAAKMPGTSLSLTWEDSTASVALPLTSCENSFYYRLQGSVKPETVEQLWGEVVWLTRKDQPANEVAFMTACMKEGEAVKAEKQLQDAVILSKIRYLD
ncbi:MAG: homoserine dehydrogenase [Oscillospiraceae bacterium]|nr:homoserine dehydrogenase [Oscillospiraceae bacterium]MBQ2791842.1 homoserine dehydrogenase [Oscillospiraceae bacterium]MBR2635721.1 homoserine dehydrogenase [Oscillospiraceae bacterium]